MTINIRIKDNDIIRYDIDKKELINLLNKKIDKITIIDRRGFYVELVLSNNKK